VVEIVMTFCRFKKDKNFNPIGYPQYIQIRSHSAKGINAEVQMLRDGNDVVKFTPWSFVRLDSVEVV